MKLLLLLVCLLFFGCTTSAKKVIVENCERVYNSEKWVCEL